MRLVTYFRNLWLHLVMDTRKNVHVKEIDYTVSSRRLIFCLGRLKEFKTLITRRNKTRNTENNVLAEVTQFRAPLLSAITKTYVCLRLCNVCWDNSNVQPQSRGIYLRSFSPHYWRNHPIITPITDLICNRVIKPYSFPTGTLEK